jgi:hypothetical protein
MRLPRAHEKTAFSLRADSGWRTITKKACKNRKVDYFFFAVFLLAVFLLPTFFLAAFFLAPFFLAAFLVATFFLAAFLAAFFLVAAFLATFLLVAAFLVAAFFFLATFSPPLKRKHGKKTFKTTTATC